MGQIWHRSLFLFVTLLKISNNSANFGGGGQDPPLNHQITSFSPLFSLFHQKKMVQITITSSLFISPITGQKCPNHHIFFLQILALKMKDLSYIMCRQAKKRGAKIKKVHINVLRHLKFMLAKRKKFGEKDIKSTIK